MMGMRYAINGRFAFFNLLSGFGYCKTRWLADMTATRCAQIYRIGSMVFWRRLLGDAQRWLAARTPLAARHLLLAARRRDVDDLRQDQAGPALERRPPPVTVAERAAFRTLIVAARRGNCEWLSMPELMAAMPAAGGHPPQPNRMPRYAVVSARPEGAA
jgi:hypothetical protein